METKKLSPKLHQGIVGYFPEDQLERVKKVCDEILKLKKSGDLEMRICNGVAKMNELNFGSVTYLIHQISEFFFGINESIDLDFLEKTLGESKDDLQLLTVALQDIYGLYCLGKSFNVKKEALIRIIMLNMKFGGANSGGVSSDNIAAIIAEEVLGNSKCDKQSIISHLKKTSTLDKEKFPTEESLNRRKQGASCPLYAFKDSNDFIRELWSIVELIFTVINIKFRSPANKEELFLTGNKL